MPKSIGYQEASKMSSFRRKKSKDEKSLKKPKYNKRTESVIKGLVAAGFSRAEAEARADKKKGNK